MKQFVKYSILVIIAFLVSSCVNSRKKTGSVIDNRWVTLSQWQYYTGKQPQGINTKPITIHDLLTSKAWKAIPVPNKIPENYNGENIWLKTELPAWKGTDPAIYMGQINYGMNLFLNNRLIYHLGNFSSSQNHFMGWDQNLVQLPFFKKGDALIIKLRLGDKQTGLDGKVLLGSSKKIVKRIFTRDINNIIFSVVFLLFGIVILILYFTSYRLKMLRGVFVLLISMGIFIVVNTTFFKILFRYPQAFYQLDYSSLIASTIGVFYVIEKIVSARYKKIASFIWKLHLAVLVLFILLINFTRIIYLDILVYFLILTTIDVVISLVTMVLSARRGNYKSKILTIGMIGFLFFAILENILYFIYGAKSNFGYNVRVLHFGVLLFVGSMIWVAVRDYIDTNKQKEIIRQKELEAIRRENEARRHFSTRLLESQENERNRIALELHDSVGQKLILIKNQLLSKIRGSSDDSLNKSLAVISDLTGDTIAEIRNITHNLRPQFLDQLGLKAAIEYMVENLTNSSDITFHIYIDEIDGLIPEKDEINFFRIIQESLNNIIKHSQASEAFLKIERTAGRIDLEIKDNGVGIDKNLLSPVTGTGVTGMKERAMIIGASLEFAENGISGTTVKMAYRLKNK